MLESILRKKVPKSGHVHGPRNRRTAGTMWHPTPKRASGNERVINRGARGRSPRRSFLRLSPEKAGLPPGVGRETTSQVLTCAGPEKTTSPPSWAGWIRKATPRDSLRPGFLLEKAWIPARDRAGRTTLQVLTCEGPRRTHLPTANPARWEGNLAMFRRGRLTALSAGGGYPLPGTLGRGTPPGAGRPPGPSTAGGCPRGLSWRRSPCASRR